LLFFFFEFLSGNRFPPSSRRFGVSKTQIFCWKKRTLESTTKIPQAGFLDKKNPEIFATSGKLDNKREEAGGGGKVVPSRVPGKVWPKFEPRIQGPVIQKVQKEAGVNTPSLIWRRRGRGS